ncbi:ring-cleaving dioxygenase [Haliscomenobacter sp.]|uniref:ring-cleaving dioxygenase n=1 Tax=Haliscomenobacter sp. TaxID=2717303 RepID=UPI003BAD89C1
MLPSTYINGLHHLTVCVGAAQEDVDFNTQVLGLRMIKQTVLFDGAASIYHLYYANANAEVGSVWTTFPFKQAGVQGRIGSGQIERSMFSVPTHALPFWVQHLNKHGVGNSGIISRLGVKMIEFAHPCGLGLAVVGDDSDQRKAWHTDEIREEDGIKGIYGVQITSRDMEGMEHYLKTVLGFTAAAQDGDFYRFQVKDGGAARIVDVHHVPDLPQGSWHFAEGIPHHVAFAVDSDEQNTELKAYIEGFGYTDVTELKDRNYFHSIYNRTPSGVLFEYATSDIGFFIDESADQLGHHLLLPPHMLDRRDEIIAPLEPIKVPAYIA